MKKIFLILCLLIFSEINAQWTVVSQTPSRSLINSISVVDQNVIWIACDTAKLYKTTNGGVTWLLRNSGLPSSNLYGISALDTTHCWVGNGNGSIYKTRDGGATWSLQFSLANSFSNGIKMFNMDYGVYYGDPIATGSQIQLRYTTNGGTDWLLSPDAPVSNNEFGVINAWDWLDSGKFWIGSANTVSYSTSARIFRLSNGFMGGNWNPSLLSGSGNSQGLFYQAIAFTDANKGMAGSNGTSLRRTTDGGLTWTAVSSPDGIPSFFTYSMNGMKDGSNIIRVCLGTGAGTFRFFKTTNLGSSWIEESMPPLGAANGIQHMQFISSILGFAGGRSGLFMRYGTPTGISPVNNITPESFKLKQNFPNPFNPETSISYNIAIPDVHVSLKVFDVMGRMVAELVNEKQSAGSYSVKFTAGDISSGIYFYRLEAGNFIETKNMVILK